MNYQHSTEPESGGIAPRNLWHFVHQEWLVPSTIFLLCAVATAYMVLSEGQFDHTWAFVLFTASLVALMFLLSRVALSWRRFQVLLAERREILRLSLQIEASIKGSSRAFHGVQTVEFSVDHVVVCPAGVFAISVIFPVKPESANASARFDGEFLHLGGIAPVREPVARARVVARGLGELIKERIGRWGEVTPVLLLPGWVVHPGETPIHMGWVVSVSDFLMGLPKLPEVFDAQELIQARTALSDIVREGQRRTRYLTRSGEIGS